MFRLVYLLLALAIAGQAGCGSIATTDTGISIYQLSAPAAIAPIDLAGAPAAAPPGATMVDMEPVDDSILAAVLEGFTSSDWLPYENAQAPPQLALSTTTHTHPKWVFSQNNPSFDLPLQSSLVPRSSTGSGTPTFTRATGAAHTDFEGKLNAVPTGCARFQGARFVRNITPTSSENFSAAPYAATAVTVASGRIDPNGGTNAYHFTSTGADGFVNFAGPTFVLGRSYRISLYVKQGDAGSASMRFYFDNGGPLGTSFLTYTTTPSWQRITSNVLTATSTAISTFIAVAGGGSTFSTGKTVQVAFYEIEDVTGQANQNPSEYVPALATANADSNAIGVRYFPYLNANTVASNVVTEAQGAAINSGQAACAGGVTAGVVDAVGPLGYLAEGVRTNLALQSQTFQTWWTPESVTLTPDQAVAPDGTTTADLLFPTTTGANRYLSQIIANSVATYTWSVYAKAAGKNFVTFFRPTDGLTNVWYNLGTGAVGTNATGFTASMDALPNGWYRCNLTGTSALATTFYIGVADADNSLTATTSGTNGIYIWGAQNEAAPFASSYIPTTTIAVQRNADVLTYPSAGNISGTQGSAYAEVTVSTAPGNPVFIGDGGSVLAEVFYQNSSNKFAIYDGTNTVVFGNSKTPPVTTPIKVAVSWSGVVMNGAESGSAVGSGTFDGVLGTGAIGIGHANSGQQTYSTIRNVRIYPIVLNPVKLQSMTAANDWGAPVYADLSDSRYLISANDERYRKVANGAR